MGHTMGKEMEGWGEGEGALRIPPMGDMTRTVCMFSRQRYTKCERIVSRDSVLPAALTLRAGAGYDEG